jgi:hypothetical protein
MEVATFQGEIINGTIHFAKDVHLPKSGKVYVVVNDAAFKVKLSILN